MGVGLLSSRAPRAWRGAMAHDALSELFEENDVPVLGVVANMGEFVCEECGHPHELFEGEDAIDALEVPVLANIPFTPEMQERPRPTDDGVTEYAAELGAAVQDRIEEIWDVEVPDDAVDLRDVPPEERRERVKEGFQTAASGERFHIVSDRDPTPVREYLLEMIGEEGSLDSFQVKRQNPETWMARTTRP